MWAEHTTSLNTPRKTVLMKCVSEFIHMLFLLLSRSVVSDSFETPRRVACRALLPNSPGKNTGVGCYALLQGIFPTQRSNLCLLLWQANSLPLNHLGSPYMHIHTNKYVCVGIYTELAMLGVSNCLKKKKQLKPMAIKITNKEIHLSLRPGYR